LAKFIIDTGKALSDMKEEDRPSKVVFIVSTDGQENASKEYSGAAIKKMVEEQTNTWKWEFVYLGANQDAVLTGGGLGFKTNSSLTYNASKAGVTNVYGALSHTVSSYRSGASGSMSFSDDDRLKSMAK
jgi:hypothetical protein